MTDRMRCTNCNRDKAYPDGFPNAAFAECWGCAWQSHLRNSHRRWWRKNVIKPARKAARLRYESEETNLRIERATTELAAKLVKPLPTERGQA